MTETVEAGAAFGACFYSHQRWTLFPKARPCELIDVTSILLDVRGKGQEYYRMRLGLWNLGSETGWACYCNFSVAIHIRTKDASSVLLEIAICQVHLTYFTIRCSSTPTVRL